MSKGKENFDNMLNAFLKGQNNEENIKNAAHDLRVLYNALREEGFRDIQAMHIIDTVLTGAFQ